MAVGRKENVVVDEENRVSARPVNANISLDCQASWGRMEVVERDFRFPAQYFDLPPGARLVARVNDADFAW
jgi:hypothetical protein